MHWLSSPRRLVCLAFVACLAGCGTSYPYYTLEGSTESRVVMIHLGEDDTFKVPAGTGIGAGLTPAIKAEAASGPVVIEKGPAKVTVTHKPPFFVVSKVEYEGEEVRFHEPIL